MIIVGVCEDNKDDLEMICHYIQDYGEVNQYELEIVANVSGKEFWSHYEFEKYSILFLDVYLDDTTGVEIAKKIRRLGDDCALVFMTSSRDHAIEGYELKALHYLIKPITKDLLFEAMTRCEAILAREMKYIDVHSGKLNYRISLKDIIYIEVYDKVSMIHTVTETIETYCPLSQLEKQIGGSPFLRCHRCSIINMFYVEDFTANDFIMKDGTAIAIRKVGSVEIRQRYLDFVFERVRGEEFGS